MYRIFANEDFLDNDFSIFIYDIVKYSILAPVHIPPTRTCV